MENQEHLVKFPDELLEEILCRLPVKSLLRFSCVSKSCYSLLLNPNFIKNHLTKSTNNTNFKHHNFILQSYKDCETKRCSVHSLQSCDSERPVRAVSFYKHPWTYKSEDVRIWGTCNGLICVGVGSRDVYLWNPATKKSTKLPSSGIKTNGSHFTAYGLGYEEANDDYKVVAIHGPVGDHVDNEKELRVYSSKQKCWNIFKNVNLHNGIPCIFGAIYVNGKFHWQLTDFANQINHIAVLDLSGHYDTDKKVICSSLAPPMGSSEEYNGGLWTLSEVNGSLCALCDNNNTKKNDVWILRENNIWSKMVSIKYLSTNNQMSYSYRMPLWVNPNCEEIVVKSDDGFEFFNAKGNSLRHLETDFGGCHLVGIYVESLVFPFAL